MEKNRNKGKKTVKLSEIKLEYLKGSPVDGKTARNALTFMGSLLVMAIAFLLLGMAMMMDNAVLRVAFNGCLIAAALVLALVAQRQMTALGALPSWVSAFEGRTEIGNAVAYYHQPAALTVEDVLRVIIRVLMMPLVNIVNPYGADALLTLERLSPLVMMVPALAYGVGYTQGVRARKQVHAGIAEGEIKRKKKEKRQRKAQQRRVPKGPEQLN